MSSEKENLITSLACVVQAAFPGIKDKPSSCGVLLNPQKGILLSHGSILADYHSSNNALLPKIKAGEIVSSSDLSGCSFTVLLDRCWRPASLSVAQSLTTGTECDFRESLGRDSFLAPLKCSLLGAFRNQDFHSAMCKIMPEDSWSFANAIEEDSVSSPEKNQHTGRESNDNVDNSVSFQLLSYFLLLRCDSLIYQENKLPPVLANPVRKECCTIGTEAEIVSTPFGGLNPHVFFNSYSRGVISNVSGPGGCWILTDARCIPGSEGGPLFTVHADGARQLAGVVVASLCWKNKEWVGLSLVCGIESIFKALSSCITRSAPALDWQKSDSLDLYSAVSENHRSESNIASLGTDFKSKGLPFMPYVVLVKVGRVWGSGYVIDTQRGLILTCSHVIRDASPSNPNMMVRVYTSSRQFKASVIYRQVSEEISPFDLALLRCPEALPYLVPRSVPKIVAPSIGQRVWVCGHAVFNSDLGLQPSVSAGVISKVVKVRGQDIMVQSTCAVHAGASGGPLLDVDGNLVGIVVCNTVDKGSNSTYPHINFSIPAVTVWPTIQHYANTGDASVMKTLKVTDPLVKRLWALDTSLETDPALKSKL